MNTQFLDKAQTSLAAAELLLEKKDLDGATNRAYYAAFHAARAALIATGRSSLSLKWSHAGVQREFATLIQQRKNLPSSMKKALCSLLSYRELADYSAEMVSSRVAKEAVRLARELVAGVEKEIQK